MRSQSARSHPLTCQPLRLFSAPPTDPSLPLQCHRWPRAHAAAAAGRRGRHAGAAAGVRFARAHAAPAARRAAQRMPCTLLLRPAPPGAVRGRPAAPQHAAPPAQLPARTAAPQHPLVRRQPHAQLSCKGRHPAPPRAAARHGAARTGACGGLPCAQPRARGRQARAQRQRQRQRAQWQQARAQPVSQPERRQARAEPGCQPAWRRGGQAAAQPGARTCAAAARDAGGAGGVAHAALLGRQRGGAGAAAGDDSVGRANLYASPRNRSRGRAAAAGAVVDGALRRLDGARPRGLVSASGCRAR